MRAAVVHSFDKPLQIDEVPKPEVGPGPGGNNGTSLLVPGPKTTAIVVIVGWLAGWTALGAWRMVKRDA
jgi:hypothetical protein